MTSRRQVLAAFLAATPASVLAQLSKPRIGILSARPLKTSIYGAALVRALAEAGYKDGARAVLEYRSVDDVAERYPRFARELVKAKCDVIFVFANEASTARAVLDLRSTIPTVFLAEFDPVEKGIVSSLARPGGNATGVWFPVRAFLAKRLQILREIVPTARRILVLADSWSKEHVSGVREAAAALALELTVIQFEAQPYDFASAFATGRKDGVQGVIILSSPVFVGNMGELSRLAVEYKLPSVGSGVPGVLVGYHGSIQGSARQAAGIGVRILKGAKPGDIPVEQVDQFDLTINASVARALRIKIPESVLARATRIIQ